jgi:acetyl esterase/lipase
LLRTVPSRDLASIDIPRTRAAQNQLLRLLGYRGYGRAGGIVDLTIAGGIPARLYRPRTKGPVPTIVFFHGGGWVFGSVPSYDAQCKRLRDDTGAVVLSVEYRRGRGRHRGDAVGGEQHRATRRRCGRARRRGR